MSWELRVNRVIDHVRTHLTDPLSVDDLARVAHASRYHFSRRFKATTGETPVQFVQRARLERAAFLMKAGDRELGDIALEAGFSSASDFSRVFSQRYGLAPSRWDRRSRLTDGLPRFDDFLAESRHDAPVLNGRVHTHPACRIAYVRVATPFADDDLLRAGYERLVGWCERAGVDWRTEQLLGLSWDHPDTTPIDQVRYDLGFTVPDGVEIRDLGEHRFDALRAVHVRVSGPKVHIALAWAYLYDTWLPRAGAEPADLPGIKRFRRRPDEVGWDRWELDCTLALQ